MVNPAVKENSRTLSSSQKRTTTPGSRRERKGEAQAQEAQDRIPTTRQKALNNADKGRKRAASAVASASAEKKARTQAGGGKAPTQYSAPVDIGAAMPNTVEGADKAASKSSKRRGKDKQIPAVDDSEVDNDAASAYDDGAPSGGEDEEAELLEDERPRWKTRAAVTQTATSSTPQAKAPGKREQARQAEKPQWKVLTAGSPDDDGDDEPGHSVLKEDSSSGDEDDSGDDSNSPTGNAAWPIDISLVTREGTRYIRLLDQRPKVQETIRLAMNKVTADAIFLTPYPAPDGFPRVLRNSLREAAHELGYDPINLRLQQDPSYAKMMGYPVKVRFFNFRCDIAEIAERKVDGFFGLLPGCEELVRELTEGDTFIYPPAPTGNGKLLRDKPYMSHAVKAVVGHPFRDSRAVGSQNISRFTTSITEDPDYQEPEMTIPLVALGATMIHAALLCWRTGHYRHIKFNADDHYNTYTHHVLVLKTIRERKPKTFHRLMAELLSDAVSGSKKDNITTTDDDAIAAVDFDAMED